jgi:hypothetical protein
MKATETLKALRKLKVDCLYNKDTHFNAGQRVHTEAHRFRLFLIIGTISASFSTIMNVGVWDKIPGDTVIIQVIVNVLGALGGFLMLYTTTFTGYNDKIELSSKHYSTANNINLLYKKVRTTEAAYIDTLISEQDLLKKLDEYITEYTSFSNAAPITKEVDFLKTKENIDKGYADYTKEELKV